MRDYKIQGGAEKTHVFKDIIKFAYFKDNNYSNKKYLNEF